MNTKSLSIFLPIIVLSHSFDNLHNRNETLMQEYRQPRFSGRIVKVYSGTRPQPIVCPGEGFLPDPVDCSVFYRCVVSTNGKYTSFRFQCGPGTIYDSESEICNFPQSTRRSKCGGISAQFVPRYYKNELNYLNHELPSPIRNLPYSEGTTTKIKQYTSNSFATSTKRQAFQSMFSSTSPWEQTTLYQTPNPSKSLSATLRPNSHSRDLCTTDGFVGDSEDCRKFYRCVSNLRGSFIRYEFICSENTIWDEDAKSCNHAWAVQRRRCGRENTPKRMATDLNMQSSNSDNTTNQTIQQQLQVNYGSQVSQIQTQISNGSNVLQNQTQINYGDRIDNKRESYTKQNQTQISHESSVSQTETQIYYGNKGTQTQLQIDHSKESSQSQIQIQHENDQGPESTSESSSNNENTSSECTQSGFMGDKKDCKKFYRCVDNGKGSYTKYEFSCGDGTVWDLNIEGCNHAWAVKDCDGKSPSSTNTQNNQAALTSTVKTSTQNYYTTTGPTIDEEEIDNSYGNQNPTSDTNTQVTSSTTGTNQNKPTMVAMIIISENTECSSSGFVGDKNDCKKFYRCVDDGRGSFTKYVFNCGEGTVWDPDIEACNHAWAVKKCGVSLTGNTNQVETTTKTDAALTTVTLIQTTTEGSGQNNNYDVGYEQQQNESPATTTTSITTKRPQNEEMDKCKSSGFIGDKNDCKKFYRCVDNGNGAYTRYEFSCGEGTVWDPKIEACNHAWAVERCGEDNSDFNKETTTSKVIEENTQSSSTETQTASTSTKEPSSIPIPTEKPASITQCKKEGFIGDRNNCKNFYRCVDNGQGGFIKYEFTCGEGTVWDPEISTCNYPTPNHSCTKDSGQSGIENIEKEDDEIYTERTTTQTSTLMTESAGNTGSTSRRPEATDKICKSEGFYGDPDDCKKFYRCVSNGNGDYTKYDFTCGDGTVWDQEIRGCNHASENKNCLQSSNSQSQSTESSGSTSTTESPTEHSTFKPEPTSDDRCTSEGFYANSKDCKKFYRCVDNGNGGHTKFNFACGEGTIWVQDLQTCDHDNGITNCSEVNYSSSQDTGYIDQTSTTSSTAPPKDNDEYPSEDSNSSPSSKEDCTAEGFYPHKNECTRFYRCVDNGNKGYTKYEFTCGEGTAWDSNIQTCNHKNEVQSCQDSNQLKPEEHDEITTESSTTKSPTSGSTTKSSIPENTEACEQEGYYGNKDDCKKFYRCVDNGNSGYTKYDFTCGEGTIWDQDITTCNHPQDVKNPLCEQSESSSTSSTSGTSSSSSTTESPSGTTQSNNGNCSQEDSSKNPANKDVKCTKAGFYADPNDCKKFYRCVDWDGEGQKFSVYHFDCGEGTIWDPALDTCNHEDSVYPPRNCSGSQTQNENSNQETMEGTSTTQEESSTSTDENTTTTQTTTENQTTAQQSTTQKQTTTEQTTTQQSTTSQQTTTEQTTTHQTTTIESTLQTTKQQSTTSEQTTTQKSTTIEQTTTQQSSNSEQSSTQESTTKQTTEKTTTQQSTSAPDKNTTEQSTSSEESTTQTTEQTMTDSTTDSSTTEQQSTTQSNETTEQQTESSTTESEQESTTENEPGTTESSSQDKECPETDDDQHLFVCPTSFRRHPKYCNLFYQCDEDDDSHEVKIAVFKCPNETIYDETQTKCVEKDKADKKCNGEMAKKRRIKRFDAYYKEPVIVSKENFTCPAVGYFPLEKVECSPAFLKCQTYKSGKLRGFIYQCPEGYLYWSISKRCEQQTNIKFCKKSQTNWYRRWEIPVERKNLAK